MIVKSIYACWIHFCHTYCVHSIIVCTTAAERGSSYIASCGHFLGVSSFVSASQYIVSFKSLSVSSKVDVMSYGWIISVQLSNRMYLCYITKDMINGYCLCKWETWSLLWGIWVSTLYSVTFFDMDVSIVIHDVLIHFSIICTSINGEMNKNFPSSN